LTFREVTVVYTIYYNMCIEYATLLFTALTDAIVLP